MAQVQTATNSISTPATSISKAFTSNVTAGNVVLVAITDDYGVVGQVTSISDGLGNAYTRVDDTSESSFVDSELWYAYNITGGSATVVVNFAHSVNAAIIIAEYSGLSTSNPLDVHKSASATTGTAINSGATSTTTQASELVIGIAATNGTGSNQLSVGSGYGNRVDVGNTSSGQEIMLEDKTVSSTGTQTATATLSSSGHWNAICGTFKIASAPVNTGNFFHFF